MGKPGVDPTRAVMIGDRLFDVNAAKRHAIPCIGVLWGYGGHAELSAAGASHFCEHPDHLAEMVLALR